ncbi:33355_t:CDS:10, partial [Gigaspora margarita]
QFPQSIEDLDFSDIEENIKKIFKNAGNIKDIDMPMNPDPKIGNLTSKGRVQETEEEKFVEKNWTETYVQWSPLGTYLATFHHQGIALWDFSPNGKYLVTWSNEPITLGPNGGAGTPFGPEDEDAKLLFGLFMVGQQGQQRQQVLSVYETPSMGLVGNKSIKIEGLIDFEWAPAFDKEKEKDKHSGEKKQREELLSYWTPEIGNQPALDRHTKTKKSTFSNLEIFRVREKDIPIEVIEGERFAIIATSDPNYGQTNTRWRDLKNGVSFYYLETDKGDSVGTANFKLMKTLEKKTSNIIYWSPQGRHKESAKADPACLQLMFTQEHYGVTDVEWDPIDRYVITSSSFWRYKSNKKNLSEYSKLFDKEDEYARLKLSKGQIELQRRLMEELNAWRGRVKKICQRKGKMLVFLQKVPSFDNIAKFEFKEHR